MEQLLKAGLVGAGLVKVHTPIMVGRYNKALEQIGISPTTLGSFTIDGVGWSPEVAAEKGNPLYLFQGEANRCAILLSPEQLGKPIYLEYASYERNLMRAYAGRFRQQIADITTTDPAVLVLDQQISRYDTPLDLPLDYVEVTTYVANLSEAAHAQKALVARLMAGSEWMDASVRQQLAESAREYGDLRYRACQVPDFVFKDCGHFFTEAFGGVFVIKLKKETLLILERPDIAKLQCGIARDGTHVLALHDPALPRILLERQLARVDLQWYADHEGELEDVRQCLVAALVTSAAPDTPTYLGMSEPKRKAVLAKLQPDKLKVYSALERLQRRLRRESAEAVAARELEPELALLLMRPTRTSKTKNPRRDPRYETVSIVLSRLRSHDPLELYRADKNRFLQHYQTWPAAYQEWASARIKERYEPVMNRPIEKE